MSIGILVEDQDDTETLKIILRKLGCSRVYRVWVRQGDMLKVGKVSSHIKSLKGRHPDVRSVLIFIDSESTDPGVTKEKTSNCERELNDRHTRVSIRYIVVDHSLEGWLCADQNALQKVLGPRAKINIKGNPENHPRPAQLLSRIFQANGKPFNKSVHNPTIAEAIEDPRLIAKTSPTFAYLLQTLPAW